MTIILLFEKFFIFELVKFWIKTLGVCHSPVDMHAHSYTLSHTLAHSYTLSHTLAHSRALLRTLAHSRALSRTLAHSRALAPKLQKSHPRIACKNVFGAWTMQRQSVPTDSGARFEFGRNQTNPRSCCLLSNHKPVFYRRQQNDNNCHQKYIVD